jgi:hypothetical protein
MRADDGTVDDGAGLIDLELELLEDDRPVPAHGPVVEAVVDRLPWTESLGQVSPRKTCLEPEENGLDEEPVAAQRGGPALLFRKKGLKSAPLRFRQSVPVHAPFGS